MFFCTCIGQRYTGAALACKTLPKNSLPPNMATNSTELATIFVGKLVNKLVSSDMTNIRFEQVVPYLDKNSTDR